MWLCFVAGGRAQAFDLLARGDGMAEFRGRDPHLVKKALAIAQCSRSNASQDNSSRFRIRRTSRRCSRHRSRTTSSLSTVRVRRGWR